MLLCKNTHEIKLRYLLHRTVKPRPENEAREWGEDVKRFESFSDDDDVEHFPKN